MLLNLIDLNSKYNLDIKGVVHIGAHFGQEFFTYKSLGIENVIFFEPILSTFQRLKENVGDSAKLINKALGNFEGHVEMNVETNNQGQSSSVLEPVLHLTQYPHITFPHKQTVEITTLDRYLVEAPNHNFINVDVQGYELEVFRGGAEFLKMVDYIMTEVNRDEVYKNCARVEELDEFLLTYGFQRVETTWDGETWGDAFYIKKNG